MIGRKHAWKVSDAEHNMKVYTYRQGWFHFLRGIILGAGVTTIVFSELIQRGVVG